MTIRQAIDARIPRVKLPEWHTGCRLELPLLPDGGCGPWVQLIDPNAGNATILITELLKNDSGRYEAVVA